MKSTIKNILKEAKQKLKKDLMILRKSIIPLRESVGNLEKSGSDLIEARTTFFLKDVYDHTLHITDSIETYREMLLVIPHPQFRKAFSIVSKLGAKSTLVLGLLFETVRPNFRPQPSFRNASCNL